MTHLRAVHHRQRNGTRQLIEGASDGMVHAVKPQTGEPIWKYEISKRGINSGVVMYGTNAIVTQAKRILTRRRWG